MPKEDKVVPVASKNDAALLSVALDLFNQDNMEENAFFAIKDNLNLFDDKALAIATMDNMSTKIIRDWVKKMVGQGKKEQVILALEAALQKPNQVKGSTLDLEIMDILDELYQPPFPFNYISRFIEFVTETYHKVSNKISNFFSKLASCFRSKASEEVVFGDDTVGSVKAVNDEKVNSLKSKSDTAMTTSGYVQVLSKETIKHSLDEKYPQPKEEKYPLSSTIDSDDDDNDDTFDNVEIIEGMEKDLPGKKFGKS